MPRAWRLVRERFTATAFTGEGARLYGGRWSSPGTRIVYCAASLPLAALELLVHCEEQDLPGGFSAIPVTVPEDLPLVEMAPAELPAGWRGVPAPGSLAELGSAWVRAGRTVGMVVPSALFPGEHNLLLNPAHPDFPRIVIGAPEPFAFDPRLRPGAELAAQPQPGDQPTGSSNQKTDPPGLPTA